MKKARQAQEIVDLPFPIGGLDETRPYAEQRRTTTASVQNVRPFDCATGRRRGARRPGMSKYLADQIASAEIQCIDAAVLPRGAAVGSGTMLTTAAGANYVRIYSTVSGVATNSYESAVFDTANTIGKYDEDNNAYIACDNSGTVVVRRVSPQFFTHTQHSWSSAGVNPGSSYRLCGLAVSDGVVYVYMAGTAVSAIYRLDAVTGEVIGSGAWMTHNDGLNVVTLGNGSRNMMAIGGGLIGVLGKDGTNNLVIQLINIANRSISYSTAIIAGYDPFNGSCVALNICSDSGANFYVAALTSNGAGSYHSRTRKVKWDGTVVWTKTDSASPSGTAIGIRDCSYDEDGGRLGVVGLSIHGTGNSFQTLNPDTGAFAAGSDPYGAGTWERIAADTYTDPTGADTDLGPGFVLRRAAGANDIARLKKTLATHWQAYSGVNATGFISATSVAPAATSSQGNVRLQRLLAIADGTLYRFDSGDSDKIKSGFSAASAAATAFAPATVVWGSKLAFTVFFADGYSYPMYNFSTNTTDTLEAYMPRVSPSRTDTAPVDANGRRCRLIETWRGRLVMAGMLSDPQNWFMSKVGDATTWAYDEVSSLAAVSGSLSAALQVGDIINGMVPCGDNILIFLCDHSIWRMTGDPLDGGVVTQVSDITGGAWGRAWCKDAQGNVYFFGSRGSVWRMAPDGEPQRISTAIDASRLAGIDLSTHLIRMAWDDRWRGIHLFVTPYDSTEPTVNYWWDADTQVRQTIDIVKTPGSWWPDVFANVSHNPLAVYAFDGDGSDGRVILMGGRDGYIRQFDNTAESDDAYPIESELLIGPIQDKDQAFILTDVRATMGTESAGATLGVRAAVGTQAAFESADKYTGTLVAGQNKSRAVRVRGTSAFIRIYSNEIAAPWSLEGMQAVVEMRPGVVASRTG